MFKFGTITIISILLTYVGIIAYGSHNAKQARAYQNSLNEKLEARTDNSDLWNNKNKALRIVAYSKPKPYIPTPPSFAEKLVCNFNANLKIVHDHLNLICEVYRTFEQRTNSLCKQVETQICSIRIPRINIFNATNTTSQVTRHNIVREVSVVSVVPVTVRPYAPRATTNTAECPPVPRGRIEYAVVNYNR